VIIQGEQKVSMHLQEVEWTCTCTVLEVESSSESPIHAPYV